MQHSVAIEHIEKRAKAIHLSLKKLASRAGLSPSTAYRGLKGTDMRGSTERRLLAQLEIEEKAILAELAPLYGFRISEPVSETQLPEQQSGEAA